MPITLQAARAAAKQGRWHVVLGLQPGASTDEIRKARRLEQRTRLQEQAGSVRNGFNDAYASCDYATYGLMRTLRAL